MPEPMLTSEDRERFELANAAYNLFTLEERERALRHFASLRYPNIIDRFFDAVHAVIVGRREEPIR